MLPTLARDAIHLLYGSLDSYPVGAFVPLLSRDEQSRSARFERSCDRDRYVVGRGLLRMLLGAVSGREPDEIVFMQGGFGKPLVDALNFSVAHSRDVWACALSWQGAVGIDIEDQRSLRDRHVFRELIPLPDDSPVWQSDGAFMHWWVRQEAYAKATGIGFLRSLSQPMDAAVWWSAGFCLPDGAFGAVVAPRQTEVVVAPLTCLDSVREQLEALPENLHS